MSEPDAQGNYPGILQANQAPEFQILGDRAALFGALAKASGDFKPVLKNLENPYFKSKYADLAAVIEATRPALAANGLVLVQPPARDEGGTWKVRTLLLHASGASMEAVAAIKDVGDWQKLGSAITYCRRYVASAMLGVASEVDDDGNAASDNEPSPAQRRYEQRAQSKPPAAQPKPAQQSAPQSTPEPADVSSPNQAPAEPTVVDLGAKVKPETRAKMMGLLKELGIVGPAVAEWAQAKIGKLPSEITLEVEFQTGIADLEKRKAATA